MEQTTHVPVPLVLQRIKQLVVVPMFSLQMQRIKQLVVMPMFSFQVQMIEQLWVLPVFPIQGGSKRFFSQWPRV